MNTSLDVLEGQFETGHIVIKRVRILDARPPPLPPETTFGHVAGMMLGDSFGKGSESMCAGEPLQEDGR